MGQGQGERNLQTLDKVAVKELKLSFHTIMVYIYVYIYADIYIYIYSK